MQETDTEIFFLWVRHCDRNFFSEIGAILNVELRHFAQSCILFIGVITEYTENVLSFLRT